MKVRFLLDEHISLAIQSGLKQRQPQMDVLCLGDPDAPPLGTPDPDILHYLEIAQHALVTMSRRSMWQHITQHWQAGRDLWGVFWVPRDIRYGALIRQLLLIWETSQAEEWLDQLHDLPF